MDNEEGERSLENGTTQSESHVQASDVLATSSDMPIAETVFERRLENEGRVEIVRTNGKPLVMIVVQVHGRGGRRYLESVAIDLTDEEALALSGALYEYANGF
jgi:hypothetical protein